MEAARIKRGKRVPWNGKRETRRTSVENIFVGTADKQTAFNIFDKVRVLKSASRSARGS